MTLRDRATDTSVSRPSLSGIADYAEYTALLSGAVLVLTVSGFGAAGIVTGFSMGLVTVFANFALGVFLIGASFFGLSLLIGLIESTYFVEPDEGETLPEQAAEQQGESGGPEREVIGERRAPEEHRVK